VKFRPPASFTGAQPGCQLLPLRFWRLPWDARRVFVSSLAGDWLMMERQAFERFVRHVLPAGEPGATHLCWVSGDVFGHEKKSEPSPEPLTPAGDGRRARFGCSLTSVLPIDNGWSPAM
jgi:hypothetical protein